MTPADELHPEEVKKRSNKTIQTLMGFKPVLPDIRLRLLLFNPLTPMNDQDRISPYNIDTISTR